MSPAFLMQQMEWREAIGESRASKDTIALEELDAHLRKQVAAQQLLLTRFLDEEQNNQKAAEVVRELKFIEKLRDEVHHALEALEA